MEIFIEVLGYVGMAIVLASFLMKNALWIRIVNMCGAILCLTYGFVTNTLPTAFLNLGLFLINATFVIKYFVDLKKQQKASTTSQSKQSEEMPKNETSNKEESKKK